MFVMNLGLNAAAYESSTSSALTLVQQRSPVIKVAIFMLFQR